LPFNGTYDAILTLSSANVTATWLSTQFYISEHNHTGATGDFYIYPCDSAAYTTERGNFTLNEWVFPNGYILLTESLLDANVNVSVWSAATGLWVMDLYNAPFDFLQYGGYFLPTLMGGPFPADTALLGIGNYWLDLGITDTEIGGTNAIHTTGDFTVSLPRTMYLNASAYNGTITNPVNLTNQANLGELIYFNGTIGAVYTVATVSINITMQLNATYISTLWNGTHSFIGGVNESLTHICGDVLNYSNATGGDYRLVISVYKTDTINRTTITEGFLIGNMTTSGGPGGHNTYVSGNGPDIPNPFVGGPMDKALLGMVLVASDNLLVWMFLFVSFACLVWLMAAIRRKRRARG
jgi:hypothetical protein